MHVHAETFQPFVSRQGLDTVLSLRFGYDPQLIERLKDALQQARSTLGRTNVGGWLKEHHCWFIEHEAWPIVKQRLIEADCTIDEPEVQDEPEAKVKPEQPWLFRVEDDDGCGCFGP
jgi:hypothetical protein